MTAGATQLDPGTAADVCTGAASPHLARVVDAADLAAITGRPLALVREQLDALEARAARHGSTIYLPGGAGHVTPAAASLAIGWRHARLIGALEAHALLIRLRRGAAS